MVDAFLSAYVKSCGIEENLQTDRDARTARLLTFLLLARIDGKSPVEYLSEPKREHVRQFVRKELAANFCGSTAELSAGWFSYLNKTWNE